MEAEDGENNEGHGYRQAPKGNRTGAVQEEAQRENGQN